jgi:hypothetical protein
MKNIINYSKLLLITAISVIFVACEDPVPNDYIEDKYVEAYLLVDKPIENIVLKRTQPLNQKYASENAMIKDAIVKLSYEGKTIQLSYRDGENPGYYYADESELVKPEVLYELHITTSDGKVITASTRTPKRFDWVDEPKSRFHYPADTLNLPAVDSLKISWTPVEGVDYFLIRTKHLDTLNYGKYLEPPTDEPNRRCFNFLSKIKEWDFTYKNVTNWGLIGNTQTAAVWFAFKWFGKQTVTVFNADRNMLNWFINLYFNQTTATEPLMNSVNGAYGVFGSASFVEKEVFLYKNQP